MPLTKRLKLFLRKNLDTIPISLSGFDYPVYRKRIIARTPIDFAELSKAECHFAYPFHLALYDHYRESPFFMNRKPETQEEFIISSMQEEGRYFVAKQNGKTCAFVKISVPGETFVAVEYTYRHIRGAYCLPEHRGKGLYQNLLNYTISVLKEEGYTRLGVDFERFNLTAMDFG